MKKSGSWTAIYFPRVAIAGGLTIMMLSILCAFMRRGMMEPESAILAWAIWAGTILCILLGKHVNLGYFEQLPISYKNILMIVLIFLFALFFTVTAGNVYSGFFMVFLLLWLWAPSKTGICFKLLLGGLLFVEGMGGEVSLLTVVRFSLLFISGLLLVLYGVQYHFEKAAQNRSLISESIELFMTIAVFITVPALSSASALIAAEGFLKGRQSEFDLSEPTGSQVEASFDYSILIDIAILVVLLLLLVFIWRKFQDRGHKQKTVEEESLIELFGKSRALNLEEKGHRTVKGSWYRVIRLYYSFVDFAGKKGIERDRSKTPVEFSSQLSNIKNISENDAAVLTGIYLNARFSQREILSDDYSLASKKTDLLKQALIERSFY